MTTDKTALDDCQNAFEKWYSNNFLNKHLIKKHADGFYVFNSTLQAFEAWKSAWHTRPKPSGDAVKALDALKFIGENTSAYPNPYNPVNGLNEAFQTIHAALTQPKADVEGLKRDVFTALYPHHRYEPEHNPLVLLKDCIDHLAAQGYIGGAEGYTLVPIEPTREMLNSAIDVHGHKLCDISGIGLRISPQQMFKQSYKAMLKAAPKKER